MAAWGGWCNGQRDLTVVRPARRVWEYGRPVIRVPTPARAVPTTATHHVDEIRAVPATGWTVTVCGPAEAAPAVPRRGQRSRAGDRDWRAYAAPALSEPVRSTSVADASGHR
ncbi:hypothetical protein PV408_10410 [Streptomyces sp. ME18-1-4]|nr:hypothetical protein [Streptomyces sp. ME18-1-4]MDX3242215.1 hypothetical protein [Streptomyces sp. ME18-1-4]